MNVMCYHIKKTNIFCMSMLSIALISISACEKKHSEKINIQQKPVEVTQATQVDRISLQYIGHYTAQHMISICSLRAGKIKHIFAKEGQNVIKNDILAVLNNTDSKILLDQAQNEFETAHVNTRQLSDIVKRSAGLDEIGALSTSTIKERQTALLMARAKEKYAKDAERLAENQDQQSMIRAPENGEIIKVVAQEGTLTDINNEIVIMATGNPEIDVELYDTNTVYIGENAEIRSLINGSPFITQGEVVRISPYVDQDTKTRHVRVKLKTSLPLAFNETVVVKFLSNKVENFVRVPLVALFCKENVPCVWVITKDKKHIEEQKVTFINQSGHDAIVTGPVDGQLIVSSGPDLLQHEDVVNIVQMDDHS